VGPTGERIEVSPELGRELRQADVELIDELMPDTAEPALGGPRAEAPLLQEDDVLLTALGEEERGRDTHDAAADDERRRAVRDAQSATSV
jgi:hypothetical protein